MSELPGLRGRLRSGETVLGTFVTEFHGPGIVHLAASAGVEFVVVDDEHSSTSRRELRETIQAGHSAGTAVVVRVASPLPEHVSRALDLGAHGVMVPMVTSVEQVRAVVAAAKYPPEGRRGVALNWMHHDDPGVELEARLAHRNRASAVLVQIETAAAVDLVDEIAVVPGVDVLWLGHLDLSTSLGVPGDVDSSTYLEARARLLSAAQQHGVIAGHADLDGTQTPQLLSAGFTAVAVGTDADLYRSALVKALVVANAAAGKPHRTQKSGETGR
jgi:2-keto-3-deoxy-L-rhamnonate aldolase RhmA